MSCSVLLTCPKYAFFCLAVIFFVRLCFIFLSYVKPVYSDYLYIFYVSCACALTGCIEILPDWLLRHVVILLVVCIVGNWIKTAITLLGIVGAYQKVVGQLIEYYTKEVQTLK